MKVMQYTIDMKNVEKFGYTYVYEVRKYLNTTVYEEMTDDSILDLIVVNWAMPLNVGITKHKYFDNIDGICNRLIMGITEDEKKSLFGPGGAISIEELNQN